MPATVISSLQDQNDIEPEKFNVSEAIEKRVSRYFCTDENDFIKNLALNYNLFQNERIFEFLNRLGWNLALDPSSMLDVVNTVRYAKKNCDTAKDETVDKDEVLR